MSAYKSTLKPSGKRPPATGWYYDTGKELPRKASYSKYNLLETVQPGDIIFEGSGGFGITGHIAIVEGIYYSEKQKQKYVRIIEAIEQGVRRSVLEDTRVDNKHVTIYRVPEASKTDRLNAVNFCAGEEGADYFIDLGHDLSPNQDDWYCSELVWAAYKNQGFDIETTKNDSLIGVLPVDIIGSALTSHVTALLPILGAKRGSNNKVTLSWPKIPHITEHTIKESLQKHGPCTPFSIKTKSSYITAPPAARNIYYTVSVKGKNLRVLNSYNKTVSAKKAYLSTPKPSIKGADQNSGIFYWKKVSGANRYKVRFSKNSDVKKMGRYYFTKSQSAHMNLSALPPNTVCYYWVYAYNSSTKKASKYSTRRSFRTAPKKPALSPVKAVSSSKLKLSWGKCSGATSYRVYRKFSSGYRHVATVKGRTYTDSKLKAKKKYSYIVMAVNSKNFASAVSKKSGTTKK